ncbi:hypothetical protein [Streptomyces iconiensis]|uniref:Uncharacterized protein n=1 Tax=Streptomyces iconiensis TaxID=1384038 RepID=A0ABT6ZTS2_9ACTN|nr:hypothetical protein [Streptomyces iconiensis]MDJ1132252.1 hypothetical protein [Streptomyces iconiensis]
MPTLPPQPAPPTGEPLTAPRLPARPPGPVRPERRREEQAEDGTQSPARPEKSAPSEKSARPETHESPEQSPEPDGPEPADDAAVLEPVQQSYPADSIRPPHPLSRPAPPLGPPPAPPSPVATPGTSRDPNVPVQRAVPPPVAPPSGRAQLSARTVAAAACLVLGVGLLGGAGAGAWLTGDSGERPAAGRGFDEARTAWRDVPVDKLFPRHLTGKGAGPGAADRRWTRVAVAPDSGCAHAFDPLLTKALSPVGCSRLVRATYADETTSSVTTVGLLFTKADQEAMRDLRKRFAAENLTERTDLMPRPYAARGTVAADFGDAQRASWTVHVLSDAPVVVYSVTGFADGRVVSDPQSAADATRKGETSAPAQAGLGNDAQGIADRVERGLREGSTDSGDPGKKPGREDSR